jgi:hypothetical protein
VSLGRDGSSENGRCDAAPLKERTGRHSISNGMVSVRRSAIDLGRGRQRRLNVRANDLYPALEDDDVSDVHICQHPRVRSPKFLASISETGAEPVRRVKAGSVIVREYQGKLHEDMSFPTGSCGRDRSIRASRPTA